MCSELSCYYYDDFAEVREEIATRIRNKISALLRALAKRTSNMLSGKVSKWLLECASDVSRGKVEKAKIRLAKVQIFVKRNKVKLGVAAVALASALTTIGVLLHNRALLKRKAREAAESLSNKMKEGLTSIIRKSRNAFARKNKEEGGRPSQRGIETLVSNGKQLGGAIVTKIQKRITNAVERINRNKLEMLDIIRLAKDPKFPKEKLTKLQARLASANESPRIEGLFSGEELSKAKSSAIAKVMLKKSSELANLYHKANVLITKRMSDCAPSIYDYLI